WKDPRTSVTLPHWLRLFPGARLLHIRRDPDAVARSLHRRAQEWAVSTLQRPSIATRLVAAARNPAAAARRIAGAFISRNAGAPASDPCLDLRYCRELGEQYLVECLWWRDCGASFRELWYEDLMADPVAVARELAEYADAPGAGDRVLHAATLVRATGER